MDLIFTIIGVVVIYKFIRFLITGYWTPPPRRQLIAVNEIVLDDFKIDKGSGWGRLTGRLRNNSGKYTISKVELRITARDCPGETDEIIAQDKHMLNLEVPPGQARDVNSVVTSAKRLNPRGRLDWSFDVVHIWHKTRGFFSRPVVSP